MTPIDRTSALAALIRTQLAAQRESRQQAGAGPNTAAANSAQALKTSAQRPAAGPQSSAKPDAKPDTQAWVAQRVKQLSADDPRRRRKAFRIFLEAVLAEEFGTELTAPGGFDQWVDEVLSRMESDPELNAAMDEAGQLLLNGG